ncbi:hypothetical protein [Egbenema bharatensis]|uniref:hypothetical protein n=1 Tax=Egbenema bharatensis TaxID=3463334 RepID=UPI003A84B8DA
MVNATENNSDRVNAMVVCCKSAAITPRELATTVPQANATQLTIQNRRTALTIGEIP